MVSVVISAACDQSGVFSSQLSAFFRKELHQMRSRFIPQMTLGCVPIAEIEFDVFCRHELVPILMALQHLYVKRRHTLTKICKLIEKDIAPKGNVKLGCNGLTYWEILILAAMRLGCNLDFDQLSDLATNHRKIRQLMGISDYDVKRYPKSTINDNLLSLSAKSIDAISLLIVNEGHRFKPRAIERVRGDSYVMQKNIHYPTDSNLLVDAIRKVIHLSHQIASSYQIPGWRKHGYLYRTAKKIKRQMEQVSRSRKKDKDQKLKGLYTALLQHGNLVVDRCLETICQFQSQKQKAPLAEQLRCEQIVSELYYYIGAAQYVSELARRRVIEEEKIPNADKVFSIFEPDTELINRGKKPHPIEFGHRVLIIQDKAGFIIHAHVMGTGITDEKIIVEVMQKLQKRFNGKIRASSFDKGFWTPNNLTELSEFIPLVVLPKKGKRSQADKVREGQKEFGKARKWHAGVESAIHALGAGNGLNLCRDKGPDGYRRYLAMGVLGRNLQTLGTILLEKERERKREQMLMELLV
jgi:hypothetical protein